MKSGCKTMSDCGIIMYPCIIIWRIQDKNVDKYINNKVQKIPKINYYWKRNAKE